MYLGKKPTDKYCIVPNCKNSTKNASDKVFFPVPKGGQIRRKWCRIMRRDELPSFSRLHCCEDHFNIEEDTINYMQYKIMALQEKQNTTLRLKKGILPRKYQGQKVMKTKSKTKNTSQKVEVTNSGGKALIQQQQCRLCFLRQNEGSYMYDLLGPWVTPWNGMEATVAEDLTRLTGVKVSEDDICSTSICTMCYTSLQNACVFVKFVQNSQKNFLSLSSATAKSVHRNERDNKKKLKSQTKSNIRVKATEIKSLYCYENMSGTTAEINTSSEKLWPKPIELEKCVNVDVFGQMKIKEEVITDEEMEYSTEVSNFHDVDIKIEPEELLKPEPSKATNMSLNSSSVADTSWKNDNEAYTEEEYLEADIKEETAWEDEFLISAADLPLDCMLCCKKNRSLFGLRAHVLAEHSYNSVIRKLNGDVAPATDDLKYACGTCKRGFATSTDLMVHETCHNKSACYGCNRKFDSFSSLSRHRRWCKASGGLPTVHKTLDDVKSAFATEKHETCHNKSACYGCNRKFDSFSDLSRHRRWCKASGGLPTVHKTLDDVKRPSIEGIANASIKAQDEIIPAASTDAQSEDCETNNVSEEIPTLKSEIIETVSCTKCSDIFIDNSFLMIHLKTCHKEAETPKSNHTSKETKAEVNGETKLEVETVEQNNFGGHEKTKDALELIMLPSVEDSKEAAIKRELLNNIVDEETDDELWQDALIR